MAPLQPLTIYSQIDCMTVHPPCYSIPTVVRCAYASHCYVWYLRRSYKVNYWAHCGFELVKERANTKEQQDGQARDKTKRVTGRILKT